MKTIAYKVYEYFGEIRVVRREGVRTWRERSYPLDPRLMKYVGCFDEANAPRRWRGRKK